MVGRELIQVSLPSSAGSVKATFADLQDGTVRDLVKTLLLEDGHEIVQELVLDVQDARERTELWAIQRVVISQPNRRWTDEELLDLGSSGAPLEPNVRLSEVIPSASNEKSSNDAGRPNLPTRMFSDFALTAHLQVPLIRLVYMPYRLEVHFTHVPEIPEDFRYTWFIAGSMTVSEVIESILDELGIRRLVTQGSKSARVEYALTVDGQALPPSTQVMPYLQATQQAGPPYAIQFSVSEAWFARIGTVAKSFSKALQRPSIGSSKASRTRVDSPTNTASSGPTTASAWRPASIFGSLWSSPASSQILQSGEEDPGQGTVKAVDTGQAKSRKDAVKEENIEDENEEEGEGTLKGLEQALRAGSRSPPAGAPASSSRLSSLFDAWRQPEQPPEASTSASTRARARMVSEPVMVNDFRRASQLILDVNGLGISEGSETSDDGSASESGSIMDTLDTQFEHLMAELGIKDAQKIAMRMLGDDRKRFLIAQQKQAAGQKPASQHPIRAHKTGPEIRRSPALDQPSAQTSSSALSGLKRISMAGMGWTALAVDATPRAERNDPLASPAFSDTGSTSSAVSMETNTPPMPAPLLQTATGWSSWFSSGSPAQPPTASGSASQATVSNNDTAKDTPAFYVTRIKSGKVSQISLVKHLIALRVRLATAQLSWIKEFLDQEGMETLEGLLKKSASKKSGSIREDSNEMDESIQMECIKCLRVLMNAEIGFEQVLASSKVITYIAYSLHTGSNKLRAHVADVLAALCILSVTAGHKVVLSAFSDFKVNYSEAFRFEYLVNSIAVEDTPPGEEAEEDEPSLWEYRAAGMALINALVNGPDDIEERIALREEFARRGLNEVMTTLRYTNPPDALLTQLQVYLEERQDDQEELHDRRQARQTTTTLQPNAEYSELVQVVTSYPDSYKALLSHVKRYMRIHERELDETFRDSIFQVVDEFMCYKVEVEDFDASWSDCMSQFLASVEHVVGKQALVKSSRTTDTASVPTSFLEELETLRSRVEELTEEKASIKEQLDEKTALGNTLRSLPTETNAPDASQKTDKGNVSGVIQRLVQKEKEVLRLQAEVTKLSASKGKVEDAEAAKKERAERNRQWTNLMEEIAKNKAQIADQEAILEKRDKENKYLKRALESVYTRFQSTIEGGSTGGHVAEASTSNLDAELIVSRTIETLAQRDEEIRSLQAQLKETQRQADYIQAARTLINPLTAGPAVATPSAPPPPLVGPVSPQAPPPPPPPPSRAMSLNGFAANIRVSRPAPKPPTAALQENQPASNSNLPMPPPPPPPPLQRAATLPSSRAPAAVSGIPPPPMPPPLPPLALTPISPGSSSAPPPPPAPAFATPPAPAIKLQRTATLPGPSKKMKPFFWQKIPAQATSATIWNSIDTEGVQLDLSELEKAFAAETKQAPKAPALANKAKTTSLLPISRAQTIAIMLARMRLSHAAIRDAILQIDDKKMTTDRLKGLKTFVPTQDEMKAISSYTGEFTALTASDQYFRTIMVIPRFADRLACMTTRRRFDMDLEELRPELAILRNATDEVKVSPKFRTVLKVVLAVGNTLNASTFRGNAQGFQLEALLKLKDTRATGSSGSTSTLLHYIARLLMKQDPSLIHFLLESPHVQAASRISAASVAASVNSVTSAIAAVRAELDVMKRLPVQSPLDRFVPVMEYFVAEAEPAIVALTAMSSQLETDMKALLDFFGEDSSNVKPEDFFTTISSFSLALQLAEEEIIEEERKAKKGLKPDQQREGKANDGRRSIGRGGFDKALRDLKSGTGLRRQRQEASTQRPQSKIFLDGSRR